MEVELVKLTINGKEVEVPRGSTILQAAESNGIEIPTLCYLKDLSPMGSCRMCVVEVKGNRLLPASCVTPVAPGMEVQTESPAVINARRTILELLIANHPLDCLTCDKLGDCKLADYCYQYGVKQSPFSGEQHHYAIDDSNPFINRDMNKCIQCGACGGLAKN
jgi:formate dehydrogenase alpha subunit